MSSDPTARLAEFLSIGDSRRNLPNVRIRDAATMLVIDRSGAVPKVLLGRRHHGHKFMPGKFVFPGGRVELDDRRMSAASALDSARRGAADARGALSEPAEIPRLSPRRHPRSVRGDRPPARRQARRADARARTRPGRTSPRAAFIPISPRSISSPAPSPRRAARGASTPASSRSMPAPSPPASRAWSPPTPSSSSWYGCRSRKPCKLDMPGITMAVLEELKIRTAAGFTHDLPVPFYRMQHGKRLREFLE